MNMILYIQFEHWYVWVLRPEPHSYMLYGVWGSYGRWGKRKYAS